MYAHGHQKRKNKYILINVSIYKGEWASEWMREQWWRRRVQIKYSKKINKMNNEWIHGY